MTEETNIKTNIKVQYMEKIPKNKRTKIPKIIDRIKLISKLKVKDRQKERNIKIEKLIKKNYNYRKSVKLIQEIKTLNYKLK